jgi:general secretion pathway protein A
MYRQYYKLSLSPFENTPDPRFLYKSEDHSEAMASVEYTIRMRKGVVLVSGEIGAGKTILTHVLQQRLSDSACTILLRQGHTSANQFLKHVCRAMGLKQAAHGADRSEMLQAIEQCLLEHHAAGRPVVLIIDEAQMMSTAVLHEIRMLSNIETPTEKLVQIVLMGQPDLRTVLAEREMDPLRQRVALSHHLHGMSAVDTDRYIRHRLSVAAAPDEVPDLFTEQAINSIHRFTRGIPRLINFVADNCLLVGYVKNMAKIDEAIVSHVTENMMLSGAADLANPASGVRKVA